MVQFDYHFIQTVLFQPEIKGRRNEQMYSSQHRERTNDTILHDAARADAHIQSAKARKKVRKHDKNA